MVGLVVGAALVASACSAAAATFGTTVGATVIPADTAANGGPTSAESSAGGANAAGAPGIALAANNDPSLGSYLIGSSGLTLYVLTSDTPDTSTCTGACATNWPPLTVTNGVIIDGPEGATGPLATIARPDGTFQVTYNHMPLYYYAGDSAAGDTKGQGKNGTWFVAPLSGSLSSAAPVSVPSVSSGY